MAYCLCCLGDKRLRARRCSNNSVSPAGIGCMLALISIASVEGTLDQAKSSRVTMRHSPADRSMLNPFARRPVVAVTGSPAEVRLEVLTDAPIATTQH